MNWGSNDYLGFSQRLTVRNGAFRALRRYGAGAGAARLLAGGLRIHRQVEERLARFLGTEDALLTTTGYQANAALLVALADDPDDVIILDRRAHASTYDGARLANGTLMRFGHNDVVDLDRVLARAPSARRRLVCVESVYSMDGDAAPLAAIAEVCSRHGAWLIVDEAHAVGVHGPHGRGGCAAAGVVPVARVLTGSKALGAQGGLIAGSKAMVETVVNRGRAFIFTTAPVPAVCGAVHAALGELMDHPELPVQLEAQAVALRQALAAQGWEVPAGTSPIVPLIVGSEAAAVGLSRHLRAAGHYAPAIRPPTVPEGSCRVRLNLTLSHRPADVRRLLAATAAARAVPGLIAPPVAP